MFWKILFGPAILFWRLVDTKQEVGRFRTRMLFIAFTLTVISATNLIPVLIMMGLLILFLYIHCGLPFWDEELRKAERLMRKLKEDF